MNATEQIQAGQIEPIGKVDRLFSEKATDKNVDVPAQLREMTTYVRESGGVRIKSPDLPEHFRQCQRCPD